MLRTPWVLLSSLLFLSSCGDGTDTPTTSSSGTAPFSTTDIRVGNGAPAMNGSRLTVNYAGWLYDANAAENKGQLFDSGQGFQFTLGAGQVIAGWDRGFAGMREGGIRRLVIPPELAYGSTGAGGGAIPPNATLVFDVELVDVS